MTFSRFNTGRVLRRIAGTGFGYRAAVFGLLIIVVTAQPARAQIRRPGMMRGQQTALADTAITLDFQDLELGYVLTALAQAGGINLIYHDLPDKQVTLRTATPVLRADIPQVIRALATANGLAVTEDQGFMRIAGNVAEPDPRQFYIYRLRHARAATLAATLQSLVSGISSSNNEREIAQRYVALSQQLREMQRAAQAEATQRGQTVSITGGVEAGFQMDVLIVPEEVTNSLLVRAAPADWEIVEKAIEALDLRPLQVVIEVLITEVRRSDDLDLGVGFSAERGTAGGQGVLDLPNAPAEQDDTFLFQIGGFGDVDVQASLAALATTGEVRILSRPVILAQNNQEARIIVGSQQPFVQSSQLLVGDPTGTPYQTVQYREVGTVLNILPTINEDGYVNMSVTQEVSSATEETQFGAPVISTREAETKLLAMNGQTVVLGGLVDRQTEKVRSGIPILKDLPLIGFLFRTTREREGTSELFLFLTPYIVASDEDAEALRRRIEEQQDTIPPDLAQQNLTPPVTVIPPDIPPDVPPDSAPGKPVRSCRAPEPVGRPGGAAR